MGNQREVCVRCQEEEESCGDHWCMHIPRCSNTLINQNQQWFLVELEYDEKRMWCAAPLSFHPWSCVTIPKYQPAKRCSVALALIKVVSNALIVANCVQSKLWARFRTGGGFSVRWSPNFAKSLELSSQCSLWIPKLDHSKTKPKPKSQICGISAQQHMGVDRHKFIESQRWAFSLPTASALSSRDHQLHPTTTTTNYEKQVLFDGFCCFHIGHNNNNNNNTSDDGNSNNIPKFIKFQINDQYRDDSAMTFSLSILSLPATHMNHHHHHNMNTTNTVVNTTNTIRLLCMSFDHVSYIVDHTQISRIVRPLIESDIAFLSLMFNDNDHMSLRIFDHSNQTHNSNTHNSASTCESDDHDTMLQQPQQQQSTMSITRTATRTALDEQVTRLNEVVDQMMSRLTFMSDINQHVQYLFSSSSPSPSNTSTHTETSDKNNGQQVHDHRNMLQHKYGQWIRFMNELNMHYVPSFLNLYDNDHHVSSSRTSDHVKDDRDNGDDDDDDTMVVMTRATRVEQQLNRQYELFLSCNMTLDQAQPLSTSNHPSKSITDTHHHHHYHHRNDNNNNNSKSHHDAVVANDFGPMILQDKLKDLEQQIEKQVISLFSFSNNRAAPSEEALNELENRIGQLGQVTQQSLLMSSLPQKHFHYWWPAHHSTDCKVAKKRNWHNTFIVDRAWQL